jgi:hypothetical protein
LVAKGRKMLAPQLERCTAPNDEVAVKGVLAEILAAGLPPNLVDEEFEVAIVQAGFRSVTAIRSMREHHLTDRMGMDIGTAAMILDMLVLPQRVAQEPVQESALSRQHVISASPARLGTLRQFPAVGTTGMPEMAGWEVAGLALQALLRPVISEQARTQFARLDADPQDPMIGWVDGCTDDIASWGLCLIQG